MLQKSSRTTTWSAYVDPAYPPTLSYRLSQPTFCPFILPPSTTHPPQNDLCAEHDQTKVSQDTRLDLQCIKHQPRGEGRPKQCLDSHSTSKPGVSGQKASTYASDLSARAVYYNQRAKQSLESSQLQNSVSFASHE